MTDQHLRTSPEGQAPPGEDTKGTNLLRLLFGRILGAALSLAGFFLGSRRLGAAAALAGVAVVFFVVLAGQGLIPGVGAFDHEYPQQ